MNPARAQIRISKSPSPPGLSSVLLLLPWLLSIAFLALVSPRLSSPARSPSAVTGACHSMEAVILSHGKISKFLESSDAPERFALVNACCSLLKEKFVLFMNKYTHQPLLLQFSADTTPLRVRLSHTHQSSTKTQRRTSSATSELMVAHVTLAAKDATGGVKQAILFKEPLPLLHGKTGAALAAAFLETPGLLSMQSNMRSLRLFHSVYDLGIPPLAQKYVSGSVFLKAVQVPAVQALGQGTAEESEYEKQDWHHLHTCVGCACHCAHNSLRWALHSEFEDTSLLKDTHVALSSARACYTYVTTGILDWLHFALDPKQQIHLPSSDDLEVLWTFLGLDFDLVEQLIKWRLICRSPAGYLEIDVEVMRTESIQDLTSLLLQVWRHEAFTASRWATMGTSSRCLIRSSLTGFDACLKYLHSQEKVSDYYCGAFLAINKSQKRFLTILAMVSGPAEHVLSSAMQDNRIPRQVQQLRNNLKADLEYLSSMPDMVWSLLAKFCEDDVYTLKNSVYSGAYTSVAYLERGLLQPASALPWRLCQQESAQAALEYLERQSPADLQDRVSHKLYVLLRAGFPKQQLCQAIDLLGECSWTSYLAEKQHASASTIARLHPKLVQTHLLCWAFLHQFRQLLPAPTPEQRRFQRLIEARNRLLSKNPNKITGRQAFLQERIGGMVLANKRRREDRQPLTTQNMFKLHGAAYEDLPASQLHRYQVMAGHLRSSRDRQLQQAVEEVTEAIKVANTQAAASASESRGSTTMLFSASPLTAADLARLEVLFKEQCDNKTAAKKAVDARLRCPPPLQDKDMIATARMHQLEVPILHGLCPLTRQLVSQREVFSGSVLIIDNPIEPLYYYICLMVKKPFDLVVCPLQLMDHVVKPRPKKATWAQAAMDDIEFAWDIDCHNFYRGDPLAGSDIDNVLVVFRVLFVDHNTIISYQPATGLRGCLDQADGPGSSTDLPEVPGVAEPDLMSVAASSSDTMRPWQYQMLGLLPDGSAPKKESRSWSKLHDDPDLAEDPEDAEGDVDDDIHAVAAIMNDVEAARQSLHESGLDGMDGYKLTVLGGLWQATRAQRSNYGLKVEAKPNTVVRQMVDLYKMRRSRSFDFNLYSQHGARLLVKAWVERMAFLADLWVEAGTPVTGWTLPAPPAHFEWSTDLLAEIPALNAKATQKLEEMEREVPPL